MAQQSSQTSGVPQLTTSAGNSVAYNRSSITVGIRGPVLLQDYLLIEKLAHQNRERIPEHIVHAKSSAAYGTFTLGVTHAPTSEESVAAVAV